jgi:hypothetical protein
MGITNFKTNKEIIALNDAYSNIRKVCECGHSIYVKKKQIYKICDWCGCKVYYDDDKQEEYDNNKRKREFMYNLHKRMVKENEK